jgi:hypothetical protein
MLVTKYKRLKTGHCTARRTRCCTKLAQSASATITAGKDSTDPHARERAFEIAYEVLPGGLVRRLLPRLPTCYDATGHRCPERLED